MKQIILDGNILADTAQVHDYLKEMLVFPEYYGKNLDALHDCLTDLEDIEITITSPNEDGACFQRVLRVFKSAERESESIKLNIQEKTQNQKEDNMENEFQEYVTFHVTAKDGSDVEMAVVDEFDFEDKHYVVGAVVEDDTINDDARYIYLSIIDGDDFTVKKIEKEFDYNRITQAYLHMDE